MKRYIVLGLSSDIDRWRRERGLGPREVIAVSTLQGDTALRGLARRGDEFEVITLESWKRASLRVNQAVRDQLHIIGLTGCTVS